MKTVYTWLVAGMLATATATPALHARPLVQANTSIDSELAFQLLAKAAAPLSAQVGMTLSADNLYQDYLDGVVQIHDLGVNGAAHKYRVIYIEPGIGIADIDQF